MDSEAFGMNPVAAIRRLPIPRLPISRLPIPRLRSPIAWWRGRRAEPLPIREPYARPNRLQRNRVKLGALLFMLTLVYVLAYNLFGRFIIVQFLMPIIVMLAAIIWALPERDAAPYRHLPAFLFAYLAALLVWPDYIAIALPGIPWVTAIRLVGFPMAILFLYSLSTSKQFRIEIGSIIDQAKPAGTIITIFAVIIFLSILFSESLSTSSNKMLAAMVNWICVFFISAYVFSKPKNGRIFCYIILVVTMVICVIVMQEVRIGRVIWANSIPDIFKIEDEAVQRILSGSARAATGVYRAQSRFTTPLGLAEFLALSTPFVIYLTLQAKALWLRVALVASIGLIGWTVLQTDSRLGAGGFLSTFVLYGFVWGAKRWTDDPKSLLAPAITLAYPAIFATFIAATFFVGRLRALVWGSGAHQFSNGARIEQWVMAMPIIARRPWGYGIGESGITLAYTNAGGTLTIDSYYLTALIEYGVIGFAIFNAFFFVLIWHGQKALRRGGGWEADLILPCIVCVVNFLIIKSVFSQQENHPFMFAVAGLLTALIWGSKIHVNQPASRAIH